MIKFSIAAWIVALILPVLALGADYSINRYEDGPFSFSLNNITFNEGSSLMREGILFNEPTCPVKIEYRGMRILYEDRSFIHSGETTLNVESEIVALEIRTALYDVFGRHIKNLANVEVKDFDPGRSLVSGEWRAFDNEITRLLTTVTYVTRVRLNDGSQWVFDPDDLLLALSSLELEQKIGEDDAE